MQLSLSNIIFVINISSVYCVTKTYYDPLGRSKMEATTSSSTGLTIEKIYDAIVANSIQIGNKKTNRDDNATDDARLCKIDFLFGIAKQFLPDYFIHKYSEFYENNNVYECYNIITSAIDRNEKVPASSADDENTGINDYWLTIYQNSLEQSNFSMSKYCFINQDGYQQKLLDLRNIYDETINRDLNPIIIFTDLLNSRSFIKTRVQFDIVTFSYFLTVYINIWGVESQTCMNAKELKMAFEDLALSLSDKHIKQSKLAILYIIAAIATRMDPKKLFAILTKALCKENSKDKGIILYTESEVIWEYYCRLCAKEHKNCG